MDLLKVSLVCTDDTLTSHDSPDRGSCTCSLLRAPAVVLWHHAVLRLPKPTKSTASAGARCTRPTPPGTPPELLCLRGQACKGAPITEGMPGLEGAKLLLLLTNAGLQGSPRGPPHWASPQVGTLGLGSSTSGPRPRQSADSLPTHRALG